MGDVSAARLSDIEAIRMLMAGWIHRDNDNWDELAGLFHPDATIEITWFSGLARDFIEGSRSMDQSALRTKHFIGEPVITFAGDRALVETNAMIIGENTDLDLGTTTHNRFLDRVQRRDGIWRIAQRDSVYDFSSFTFPYGRIDIDTAAARGFPREYFALAYLLVESGFRVDRVFATRGSDLEQRIRTASAQWLAAKQRP
ncbi:nuclear transport factor 2 family protein [Mycobacterium sp.]|uniref:nuclear transport factor 2 family protein n=1 Tax=Mycobacterium sp. TaxID=1785 RepID=UPI003D0E27EE